MKEGLLYGMHPVAEALRSRARAIDYVGVARERGDAKLQRIIDDCRASGVPVRFMGREDLVRLAGTANHQGVVASVASVKKYADLDDVLGSKRGDHSFVVVLDGVEDPHNLGAIIRTADGAGVDGIIIPERRAVGVTGTVAKSSAGASEWLPIARVTNIARTVEELKAKNIWVVGLDERGNQSYDELDYNMDCALALGAEGAGLHELVRKKCDFLVSIPMLGKVTSLNVSVAAAVVMYEIARQRARRASKSQATRVTR
jgi:23S rRNA (guanosine2251-2'-O)-methyltransferase